MDKVHKSTQLVSGEFILVRVRVPTENSGSRMISKGRFYPKLEWRYVDDCVVRIGSFTRGPARVKCKTYLDVFGEVIENFGRRKVSAQIGKSTWIRINFRAKDTIAFKLTKAEATLCIQDLVREARKLKNKSEG